MLIQQRIRLSIKIVHNMAEDKPLKQNMHKCMQFIDAL